jgi:hypothetical protein
MDGSSQPQLSSSPMEFRWTSSLHHFKILIGGSLRPPFTATEVLYDWAMFGIDHDVGFHQAPILARDHSASWVASFPSGA